MLIIDGFSSVTKVPTTMTTIKKLTSFLFATLTCIISTNVSAMYEGAYYSDLEAIHRQVERDTAEALEKARRSHDRVFQLGQRNKDLFEENQRKHREFLKRTQRKYALIEDKEEKTSSYTGSIIAGVCIFAVIAGVIYYVYSEQNSNTDLSSLPPGILPQQNPEPLFLTALKNGQELKSQFSMIPLLKQQPSPSAFINSIKALFPKSRYPLVDAETNLNDYSKIILQYNKNVNKLISEHSTTLTTTAHNLMLDMKNLISEFTVMNATIDTLITMVIQQPEYTNQRILYTEELNAMQTAALQNTLKENQQTQDAALHKIKNSVDDLNWKMHYNKQY